MSYVGAKPDYLGMVADAIAAGFVPIFSVRDYSGRLGWAGPFRCLASGHVVILRAKVFPVECPQCIDEERRARRLEACRIAARLKGGRCLSTEDECASWASRAAFECANGHRWSTAISNVVHHKTWCAACVRGLPPIVARRVASSTGEIASVTERPTPKADPEKAVDLL
jgi:hypothetical protein